VEKFRDYWRAKPGAGGRKLDWDATWRNWCRNAEDRAPQRRDDAHSRRLQHFQSAMQDAGVTPADLGLLPQ
jgi:hypothetical protein